jgi:hypothetical protein
MALRFGNIEPFKIRKKGEINQIFLMTIFYLDRVNNFNSPRQSKLNTPRPILIDYPRMKNIDEQSDRLIILGGWNRFNHKLIIIFKESV